MKKAVSQYAITVLVLAVVYAAGWWSHSLYTQHYLAIDEYPQPSRQSDEHTGAQASNTLQQHNRLTIQHFSALLDQRDFEQAMALYDEVAFEDDQQADSFRQYTVAQMLRYLEDNDSEAVMGLLDLYLARHYDDTDALLILAEYQWQQGYPDESARVYQLAKTYAYQPEQLSRVNNAFNSMVAKTDNRFSEREAWVNLLGFYQLLDSISLIQPKDIYRQAQIYQLIGDEEGARQSLVSLLADPQWGDKAQQMLLAIEPAGDVNQEDVPTTGIPLQRRGSHFVVNARLNDQYNVMLMIDTGASVTSLSSDAFENLSTRRHFNRLGTRLFNTANGVTRGSVYRAQQLSLGEFDLEQVDLAILDFQQYDGIDGLLGMNVLQHFRFEIDQDRQQLILKLR